MRNTLMCCCALLVMACASTESTKPQFTWYQQALSTGGIATYTGKGFVTGDLQRIANLGKEIPLTTEELDEGRTALENCAAEVETHYPPAIIGTGLQASTLMSCLNARGWTLEYTEVVLSGS